MNPPAPVEVLAAYGFTSAARVLPITGGLINQTFTVEEGDRRIVLQRLSPIFSVEIVEDIDAVTRELARRDVATPRLVRTTTGAGFVRDDAGHAWRAITFVAGVTFHRLEDPRVAEEAGRIVGVFHAALADFQHQFSAARVGVHDTARHMKALTAALAAHPTAPRHADVSRLADEVGRAYEGLPNLADVALPERVVHGDLKISNILFDDGGRALCLVDLDTLAHMTLPLELGDAWRSWCNPLGEDVVETRFDVALLEGAWRGYRASARAFIAREERELLIVGILTVALELSARFAADVLNDSYFGWDPTRFASRAEHNWVRAAGQLGVYRALAGQRAQAERVIAEQ